MIATNKEVIKATKEINDYLNDYLYSQKESIIEQLNNVDLESEDDAQSVIDELNFNLEEEKTKVMIGNLKPNFLIIALTAAASALKYLSIDNKKIEDMTFLVERKPIQAKLIDITLEKEGFFVNIQDTKTNEKFDGIFVSKLCPLYDKNNLGKLMDINLLITYKVKYDIKITSFEGIYDYVCTDKKNVTITPEPIKQ